MPFLPQEVTYVVSANGHWYIEEIVDGNSEEEV